MTKLILGFACGLALAMAQNALYLDISRDWHRSTDDRPESLRWRDTSGTRSGGLAAW